VLQPAIAAVEINAKVKIVFFMFAFILLLRIQPMDTI
jgi:hypothetical protein